MISRVGTGTDLTSGLGPSERNILVGQFSAAHHRNIRHTVRDRSFAGNVQFFEGNPLKRHCKLRPPLSAPADAYAGRILVG